MKDSHDVTDMFQCGILLDFLVQLLQLVLVIVTNGLHIGQLFVPSINLRLHLVLDLVNLDGQLLTTLVIFGDCSGLDRVLKWSQDITSNNCLECAISKCTYHECLNFGLVQFVLGVEEVLLIQSNANVE